MSFTNNTHLIFVNSTCLLGSIGCDDCHNCGMILGGYSVVSAYSEMTGCACISKDYSVASWQQLSVQLCRETTLQLCNLCGGCPLCPCQNKVFTTQGQQEESCLYNVSELMWSSILLEGLMWPSRQWMFYIRIAGTEVVSKLTAS